MKHCLPVLLLLLSLSAHGALNKWVDADGKVHYSDEPPPSDAKEKKTLIIPGPASGVDAPKTVAEREAEWKKAQKDKEEAAQKESQKQQVTVIKQKNCESARTNLKSLQDTQLLITYDANGKQNFMDDAMRQRSIEDARKDVRNFCN